MTIMNFINL